MMLPHLLKGILVFLTVVGAGLSLPDNSSAQDNDWHHEADPFDNPEDET